MPAQTPAEIERAIREALDTRQRLSIRYLNTHLIVTPLRLVGGVLTTWADSMNRARQFRVEFIREAVVVASADDPLADDEQDNISPMGRPRIYQEPRRRLTLELPQEFVEQIDALAHMEGVTRTAWIERAIRAHLPGAE